MRKNGGTGISRMTQWIEEAFAWLTPVLALSGLSPFISSSPHRQPGESKVVFRGECVKDYRARILYVEISGEGLSRDTLNVCPSLVLPSWTIL